MDGDPKQIDALERAVEADPDFLPLRFRLARLLRDMGQAARAVEHYTEILAREPANVEALRGAESAAEQAGEASRAEGYRQLREALERSGGPPSNPDAVDGDGSAADDDDEASRPQLRVLGGGGRFKGQEDPADAAYAVENPGVTLDDVAGLESVKRRLELSFLGPMRNPEARKMFGKSLRGGLLLYGPPGCGKTFIARALAGELQASFMAVGLSDVYSMWMGESERHLKEIFDLARRKAPAVLFFDEIDALGHKRSRFEGASGARNVVNALLHEMDGVGRDTEGVYYLAATNHPWDVDTALRRPGRFDRMILVLPPDPAARAAALRYHLRERPVGDVNVERLAARTNEFSGADLAHLCESAAELALEDSISSGRTRPITEKDFKRALKEVRPSIRAWFDTARNYAMFANEGGMYDELLEHIRAHGY